MPKINNVHRLDRLKEILKKIKNNENVEIRDINNLLTDEQEQELKDMWTDEQANRKNKSYSKEQWQDKRALRIKLIERVIKELDDNLLNEIEQLRAERQRQQQQRAQERLRASITLLVSLPATFLG